MSLRLWAKEYKANQDNVFHFILISGLHSNKMERQLSILAAEMFTRGNQNALRYRSRLVVRYSLRFPLWEEGLRVCRCWRRWTIPEFSASLQIMTVYLRVAWVRIEQDYVTVERRKRGANPFTWVNQRRPLLIEALKLDIILVWSYMRQWKCVTSVTIQAKHYPSLRTVIRFDPGSCTIGADQVISIIEAGCELIAGFALSLSPHTLSFCSLPSYRCASRCKDIARSLRHVISQTAVVVILMAPCRHTMFSTDVNHMETKAAKVKKI